MAEEVSFVQRLMSPAVLHLGIKTLYCTTRTSSQSPVKCQEFMKLFFWRNPSRAIQKGLITTVNIEDRPKCWWRPDLFWDCGLFLSPRTWKITQTITIRHGNVTILLPKDKQREAPTRKCPSRTTQIFLFVVNRLISTTKVMCRPAWKAKAVRMNFNIRYHKCQCVTNGATTIVVWILWKTMGRRITTT